jgi:hypothetical protein
MGVRTSSVFSEFYVQLIDGSKILTLLIKCFFFDMLMTSLLSTESR